MKFNTLLYRSVLGIGVGIGLYFGIPEIKVTFGDIQLSEAYRRTSNKLADTNNDGDISYCEMKMFDNFFLEKCGLSIEKRFSRIKKDNIFVDNLDDITLCLKELERSTPPAAHNPVVQNGICNNF